MTIKDLARLSGYSVGTVSRALNGLPNVSEQARSAILALAQERGYQLNTNAKYLKQIHSSGIVAVVTGTSNELFAQMIERIQQTLPTDRYPLTVDYVDENEDPVERALHLSREKKPAGLLFLGGDRRMYAKSFGEITLPSVVLTTDSARLGFDNLSSVTTDDVEAAECAMEYLLESGHRRIGVIAGDLSCSGPSRLRYEGCLLALERCGLAAVFTKANADAGGADINARIDAVCAARPGQYVAFTSMGVLRYLSAMKYCAVVAGNSSSGVVETPSLGVPCVNVGDRQKGRLLSANIICCAADEASVYAALQKALSPAFAAQARQAKSPYNGGDTSGRIVRRLEAFVQSPSLGKPKLFYDGSVPGWEKEGSR